MGNPCSDQESSTSRWGRVAAQVMRNVHLSVAAKAIYATISTYADACGNIWVRQETIARDLERSRSWTNAGFAELARAGYLRIDHQFIEGRQRASRYMLLDGLERDNRGVSRRPDDGLGEAPVPDRGAGAWGRDAAVPCRDPAVQPADTNQDEDSRTESPPDACAREEKSRFSEKRAGQGPERERNNAPGVREPVPIPMDWRPTPDDLAWALVRHPDLDEPTFTERFVLSCRANGYRYADFNAAWRRWLAEPKGPLPSIRIEDFRHDRHSASSRVDDASARPSAHPSQRTHRGPTVQGRNSGDARVAAWAAAAAQRREARGLHD